MLVSKIRMPSMSTKTEGVFKQSTTCVPCLLRNRHTGAGATFLRTPSVAIFFETNSSGEGDIGYSALDDEGRDWINKNYEFVRDFEKGESFTVTR